MFSQAVPSLEDFARLVDVDPSTVAGWEEFDQIFYEHIDFPTSVALKIELAHLLPLVGEFGSALTCQFLLHTEDLDLPGDDPVVLDVRPGIDQAAINRFRQRIQGYQALYFFLRIDKSRLLAERGIHDPACAFYLYFFSSALTHFLRSETPSGLPCDVQESLRVLEDSLWPGNLKRKAVILVLDQDLLFEGRYLALMGGSNLPQWRDAIPEVAPDFERLNSIYEACRESIAWDERWVRHLTPPQLHIESHGDTDNPIVAALHMQLLNLIILFLANRTAGRDDDWCVTFSDAQYTKEMFLHSPARKEVETRVLKHVHAMYEVFKWAYDSDWPQDRIPFVQSAIAEELMRGPSADAYTMLLEKSEMILANLDRRWRQFIRQKIQTYTAEAREMEGYVVKTVDAFAERVTAMVKAVSDTMLAAIAALFGSFIAAGFGTEDFSVFIFSLGMIAYSLYVLAFPLLYSMSNQWTQYKALQESMQTWLKRFREQLEADDIHKIIGDRLEHSDRRFKRWFYITISVYVLAILLGLAAAYLVPMLFPASD